MYQILLLLVYPISFNRANLWGACLAVPFFIAAILTGKMGGGDGKAVLLLGGLVGFHQMLLIVIAGCMGFIVCGRIAGKAKGEGNISLPFLPFLTLGYVVTLILEVWTF